MTQYAPAIDRMISDALAYGRDCYNKKAGFTLSLFLDNGRVITGCPVNDHNDDCDWIIIEPATYALKSSIAAIEVIEAA